MSDLPFSLSACSMAELQSWHRQAKRYGWSEIAYDIREEMQARADEPDTISGP